MVIFVVCRNPGPINLNVFKRLSQLILLVGLTTFIGNIFEFRNWTNFAKLLLKPLITYARLPQLAGAAMITSIFSKHAANSLLAASFAEGRITRFEMRVSAICNSYITYVSHSLRIMYPIVGALGIVGACYFGMMFGAGLLITLIAMTICRLRPAAAISHQADLKSKKEDLGNSPSYQKELDSWPETLRKSGRRTQEIVFRVIWITVPLYLLVVYLNQTGLFVSWKNFVPAAAAQFFPPEVLTIMAARLGGLISAAGIASELLHQGTVNYAHILLALFAGNIITTPIRTIQRNLPSTMGIFPPRDGFFIVMTMQASRFLFALLYILLLIIYLHCKQ